uniref:Reverse transcriptase domain-containing protein n=1 Tax=Latimeria chalumnae TaxID=7897 RepID=H3AKS9_LATCH
TVECRRHDKAQKTSWLSTAAKETSSRAWNIRTLMDKDNVLRPERRTTLIARELACYNINIAAFSETRLAWEGSIEKLGGGYTFFWKGKAESEGRIHGVGFAIKTSLLKRLPDLPIGINERPISLRFLLNHRLIRAVFNLHIIPPQRKRPKMIRAVFNTAKLKHLDTHDELKQELEENLSIYLWEKRTPSEKWKTGKTVLGLKKRVHQDWFDENEDVIIKILNEKQNAFVDWQDDPTSTSKKDHFKHLQRKAQFQLQTRNFKKFFDALKTIYRPSRSGSTLIKDKAGITQHWAEHFNSLLSRSSSVDPKALDLVPQQPIKEDLDLPPSLGEVKTAISQMNTGKAPGKDGIMAEIYKAAGPKPIEILYNILSSVWEVEEMPKDFKDAIIIPLFKNKGSKADCGNYPGISLLSIAGKILNRLISNISENTLSEAQCGFRPVCNMIDMIFVVMQFLGKTEVLFQSSLTTYNNPSPSILIQGTKLKNVDNFKYLGRNISSDGSLDIERSSRLCKANQALGRLYTRVLNQHNISFSTKLIVYNAVVVTSLLYGSET